MLFAGSDVQSREKLQKQPALELLKDAISDRERQTIPTDCPDSRFTADFPLRFGIFGLPSWRRYPKAFTTAVFLASKNE